MWCLEKDVICAKGKLASKIHWDNDSDIRKVMKNVLTVHTVASGGRTIVEVVAGTLVSRTNLRMGVILWKVFGGMKMMSTTTNLATYFIVLDSCCGGDDIPREIQALEKLSLPLEAWIMVLGVTEVTLQQWQAWRWSTPRPLHLWRVSTSLPLCWRCSRSWWSPWRVKWGKGRKSVVAGSKRRAWGLYNWSSLTLLVLLLQ